MPFPGKEEPCWKLGDKMEVSVYNQKGEETGTIELPDSVFGVRWNPDLVHQIATSQAANLRVPVAHAKDRAQVRGGGKKPWRQKGTGRARHGSIRSPIWKGGGVTHGPLKEKVYKKKINKKMAKKALHMILSAKARDREIVVLENLELKGAKTKFAAEIFRNLAKTFPGINKGNRSLVATSQKEEKTRIAFRNLPFVGIDEFRNLNALEVLQYKYLVVPLPALETFKLNLDDL